MAALDQQRQPAQPTYCPLVLVVSAQALGIVLDRNVSLPLAVWFAAAASFVLAWLIVWILNRETTASWTLLGVVLAAGGAWHHAYWQLYPTHEISRALAEQSRPLCVEAIAIQSPRCVPAPPPSPLWTIPQTDKSELLVWITAVRDGQRMQ